MANLRQEWGPYTVSHDDTGTLTRIEAPDGSVVPINEQDQRFCTFLAWSSQNKMLDALPYEINPRTWYFADESELVEHCKRAGLFLFCRPRSGNMYHDFDRGAGITKKGTNEIPFVGLMKSSVRNADLSGYGRKHSNVYVTQDLFTRINNSLNNEDSGIRRVSTWPISRSFVYLDVSDFSKFTPEDEVLVINSIVRMVDDKTIWSGMIVSDARESLESQICIGDGYIFVLRDPTDATYFAAHLAQVIETSVAQETIPVAFHFRMGVHHGPVYTFWDPGRRNWNYIGDGINGGQRVLSAAGKDTDDVLFISGDVRQAITALRVQGGHHERILSCLQNRGRKKDKHENWWRVYEVNHSDLTAGSVVHPLSDI
jgi:class 3 adenylate cyclase